MALVTESEGAPECEPEPEPEPEPEGDEGESFAGWVPEEDEDGRPVREEPLDRAAFLVALRGGAWCCAGSEGDEGSECWWAWE